MSEKKYRAIVIFGIMITVGFIVYGIIYHNSLTKYHSIYIESHINNKYILYSGIMYKGNIEFQIYPAFTGTKLQCKIMKHYNDTVLNDKINYYRRLLGTSVEGE